MGKKLFILITLPLLIIVFASIFHQSASAQTATTLFGYPHDNYSIVQGCDYGSTKSCLSPNKYHTGMDSYGPYVQTPVYASGPGIVRLLPMLPYDKKTKTWPDHGMGNTLIIQHTLIGGGT